MTTRAEQQQQQQQQQQGAPSLEWTRLCAEKGHVCRLEQEKGSSGGSFVLVVGERELSRPVAKDISSEWRKQQGQFDRFWALEVRMCQLAGIPASALPANYESPWRDRRPQSADPQQCPDNDELASMAHELQDMERLYRWKCVYIDASLNHLRGGLSTAISLHSPPFASLVVLNLSDNLIESLDGALLRLPLLEVLLVDNNRIRRLEVQGKRTNLRYLDLSCNLLESVPALCDPAFSNLRHLRLAYNSLSHLPNGMAANLTFLEALDVSNNNLVSIEHAPAGNLTRLDVSGNRIRDVLPYLSNMGQLKELFTTGQHADGAEMKASEGAMMLACPSLRMINYRSVDREALANRAALAQQRESAQDARAALTAQYFRAVERERQRLHSQLNAGAQRDRQLQDAFDEFRRRAADELDAAIALLVTESTEGP